MKNPPNSKERGLLKGALRRVFSRSELRRQVLQKHLIEHQDPRRPRVTRWVWCGECGEVVPAYLTQTDHVAPIIPVNKTLEDFTWDELVDRLWCGEENLMQVCIPCHKSKSKRENAERRKFKKENKK